MQPECSTTIIVSKGAMSNRRFYEYLLDCATEDDPQYLGDPDQVEHLLEPRHLPLKKRQGPDAKRHQEQINSSQEVKK